MTRLINESMKVVMWAILFVCSLYWSILSEYPLPVIAMTYILMLVYLTRWTFWLTWETAKTLVLYFVTIVSTSLVERYDDWDIGTYQWKVQPHPLYSRATPLLKFPWKMLARKLTYPEIVLLWLAKHQVVLISLVCCAFLLLAFIYAFYVLSAFAKCAFRWRKFVADVKFSTKYVGEATVPGSTFMAATSVPAHQAAVHVFHQDKWVRAGEGFRYKNWFITATHVLGDFSAVRIVKGDVYIEVARTQFRDILPDVSAMVLPPTAVSLGLKQCKIMTVQARTFADVTAGGQRTVGFVEPYPAYGMVCYGGSTAKGFSGSPYTVGNFVVGMHSADAGVNVGFESAYIASILDRFNEDSYDWLQEVLEKEMRKSGKSPEVRYNRSSVDPDLYSIKTRNGYVWADDEQLAELRNKGYKLTEVAGPEFYKRGDTAIEKENFLLDEPIPEVPLDHNFGSLGNPIRPSVSAGAPGQKSQPSTSSAQRSSTLNSTETVESPMTRASDSMDPQRLTHAAPNDPSDTTQDLLTMYYLLLGLPAPVKRVLLKRLTSIPLGASQLMDLCKNGLTASLPGPSLN
ncbi:hypothetical protein 1 [Sanxia water strider virus 10]|uniref:hypothetical protein 1 n=1 Tax=Sanxia water strider virus 10 TaxID=1923394 RepID=UPI00090B6C46|nr:hypothetical protein 1 [Sanxia water strider virus 10]APG75874.1 hypothetical protein 1 [Sanxia water strider virus 10]